MSTSFAGLAGEALALLDVSPELGLVLLLSVSEPFIPRIPLISLLRRLPAVASSCSSSCIIWSLGESDRRLLRLLDPGEPCDDGRGMAPLLLVDAWGGLKGEWTPKPSELLEDDEEGPAGAL